MLTLDFYGLQVASERIRHQVAAAEPGAKSFCLKCMKEVEPQAHLAPRGNTVEYSCPNCTWKTVKAQTKLSGEMDDFIYMSGHIVFRKDIKIKRRDKRVPGYILPLLQTQYNWKLIEKTDGEHLIKFYLSPADQGVEGLSNLMSLASQEERVIEDAVEEAVHHEIDKIFRTSESVTFYKGHERNVPTDIPDGWYLIGRRNRASRQCTVLYAKIGATIDVLFEAMKHVISTRSETIEMQAEKIVIKSTHATRWHETETGLRSGLEKVLGKNISIVSVGHIYKPEKVDTTDIENIIDAEGKKKKLTPGQRAQLRKDKAELERLESAERLRKSIVRIKKKANRN